MKTAVRDLVLSCCAFLIASTLASCGPTRAGGSASLASNSQPATSGSLPQMSFAQIPAGSFDMGSSSKSSFDQNPVHTVTFARAFELQTTEVTQAQWRGVMGSNPAQFQGDDLPVEQVSWEDTQEFLRRLNQLDPGKGYRLPTEAEWEYACRAGSTERGVDNLGDVAWCHMNSENRTHPAGTKRANAWGLYDMLGNVWELTADWKDSYPAGPVTDPTGPEHGYYKVSRGGSWFDVGSAANPSFRSSPEPTYRGNSLGFRVARSVAG